MPLIIKIDKQDNENKNSDVCRACLLGNAAPVPQKSNVDMSRRTEPVERIHTDEVGPMKTISFGRSRYFVAALDEFSGYSIWRIVHRKEWTGDALVL